MARQKRIDGHELHQNLRNAMRRHRVRACELAHMCCMSEATFSHKMTGKSPWTTFEMYAIMDYLGLNICDLHVYFPPDGIDTQAQGDIPELVKRYCREHDSVVVPFAVTDAIKNLVNASF